MDYQRAGVDPVDDQGRHADLHSLRLTLHARLCREGVPAQIAQRTMRRADYQTTPKHYWSLRLSDDAAALAQVRAPSSTPTSQSTKQGGSARDPACDSEERVSE